MRPLRDVSAVMIFVFGTFSNVSSFVTTRAASSSVRMMSTALSLGGKKSKGKLLVLGGTGFVGQTVCKRASLEGYAVTSLSRRGLPSPDLSYFRSRTSGVSDDNSGSASTSSTTGPPVDYRVGDARNLESIRNILNEGGYVGVIHCIGLLFDDASGLGNFNRFVSGSASIPDAESTYDSITRQSAFNAIDASIEYIQNNPTQDETTQNDSSVSIPAAGFPFIFISAAEAGWPDVAGGPQIERFLAPEWLKRYLIAKRAVEEKLLSSAELRPVIPRPSLIYSLDRPASYAPVGAFFVGNTIGLPFVDRPVTVQSLANAIVRSISRESVRGIQRYDSIDKLNQ